MVDADEEVGGEGDEGGITCREVGVGYRLLVMDRSLKGLSS